MIKKPVVISIYSGGGGIDSGFRSAGFETVYATDVDEYSCGTLKKNNISKIIKLITQ